MTISRNIVVKADILFRFKKNQNLGDDSEIELGSQECRQDLGCPEPTYNGEWAWGSPAILPSEGRDRGPPEQTV